MSYENLCMNCMKDMGELPQCPHCKFNKNSQQLPPFLPHRAVIGGRYLIGNVLEANGDGVTYIAFDMERKATVTVREFFPDTIAKRLYGSLDVEIMPGKEVFYGSLRNEFLDMWRKLARMRGLSALILVIDIIEENNTAYAVSEYLEGSVTLRDFLLSSKIGYMSWEEARMMFMPVLSTISTLHSAGIIHRGISPNTLYVGPDRKIRIAGFSIPECRNVNSGIAAEIFAGYAPVEQFGVAAPSGPWTDIYAFAAVLYRALIGSTPIDSVVRMNSDRMMIPAKFAEAIPAYVINALINALQIMPEDRTKAIDQFRAELSASPTDAMAADFEAEQLTRQRAVSRQRQAAAKQAQAGGKRPAKRPAQQGKTGRVGAAGAGVAAGASATRAARSGAAGKAGAGARGGSGSSNEARVVAGNKPKSNSPIKSNAELQMAIKAGIIALAVFLLITVILFCTVFRGSLSFGKDSGNDTTTPVAENQMVEVPKFTDRTYTSIKTQTEYKANFDIQTTEEYNDKVEKGYVISQSVEPGKQVPKRSRIDLVVSLGVEQIVMIDVSNKTYDEASEELQKIGFKVKRIDKENNGSFTSGTVASFDLSVGTSYDKGKEVRLQVWADPAPDPDGADTGTIG